MGRLYFFIVAAVCFYIFLHSQWFEKLKQVGRGQGISPKKKVTMFDVRRHLIEGEKEKAVEVYRELFKVGSEEACKAVDEIERSIQPKDWCKRTISILG